jgi:hypothetical protein
LSKYVDRQTSKLNNQMNLSPFFHTDVRSDRNISEEERKIKKELLFVSNEW